MDSEIKTSKFVIKVNFPRLFCMPKLRDSCKGKKSSLKIESENSDFSRILSQGLEAKGSRIKLRKGGHKRPGLASIRINSQESLIKKEFRTLSQKFKNKYNRKCCKPPKLSALVDIMTERSNTTSATTHKGVFTV